MLVAAPANDRYVPANSIFSGPITSTLSAIRCDEVLPHASAKKKTQSLKVSNSALLLVVFK